MKKHLRILAMALFAMTTVSTSYAQEVTEGDITFDFQENGSAYVKKYNGTATEVTIPDKITNSEGKQVNVVAIGESAFEGNTTIEKVHFIKSSITAIRDKAFKGCTSLKVMNWAESTSASDTYKGDSFFITCISTVGESAFEGCTAIKTINTRYSNIVSYGANAFKNCINLTSAYLYAKNIANGVFHDCEKLTMVRLYKIESFENGVFNNLPDNAKIAIAVQEVTDDVLNQLGDFKKYTYGYLSFSSSNYMKVVSSKKAFKLASSMEVKYVKSVTETTSGVTVEIADVPEKVLPANTALILHYIGNNNSPYYSLTILDENPKVDYTNYLIANDEDIKLPASDGTTNYYTFASTTPKIKTVEGADLTTFKKVEEETSLSAGSGYLKVVNGTPTGIHELKADDKKADVYYNLNGVRVENPQKGIFIRNGKKVVIK